MRKTTTCLVLLFLIAAATSFIPGCCRKTVCTRIESLTLTAKDNSGWDPINIHGPLRARALMLHLSAEISKDVCFAPGTSLSLMPAAYATSCPEYYREDSIVSFEIYSSSRYDAKHDSGVVLNDLFNIVNIDDLYNPKVKTGTQLYLASGPDEEGTYMFSVRIELKSGKKVYASTQPLELLK